MIDHRSLAVHDPIRADHLAAESLPDTLVTETDAQNGNGRSQRPYQVHANTGLVGRAGPGGNDDAIRLHLHDIVHADGIVAYGFDLGTQFTQVLHQVVGEGVLVVDH